MNLIVATIAFRKEDPNRDFTIAAVDVMGNNEFVAEMRKQVTVSSRFKGQAFIFVHGYNISFDDAIFRTAERDLLAAANISRTVFERFVSLAKGGVTLFASQNDLAMAASKRVASGLVRAGDVPKAGIVIIPGVESIDISQASTSFFSTNHSTLPTAVS
jgi:esterase/lipase superfamily enzyme